MSDTAHNVTDWQAAGDALTSDGITRAPRLFIEEADYLRKAYIDGGVQPRTQPDRAVVPVAVDRGAATGSPVWKYISMTDPVLARLLLDPDLLGIIQKYYGRQPYLRRMPFVKKTCIAPHHAPDIASVYHIDQGKHFVGIMMLLSDLTANDSHMRFLIGTHKLGHTEFRLKANDPRLREIEDDLERKHPVYPLVGPKGTMFIYDNGSGIHKGNMISGTTRYVMQATYSRGDHATKPTDLDLMPAELQSAVAEREPIVRNAIMQIV